MESKGSSAQTDAEAKVNEYRFNAILEKEIKESGAIDSVSVVAHLDKDKLKLADDKIIGLNCENLFTIRSESDIMFSDKTKSC